MPGDNSEVIHVLGRLMIGELNPSEMTEEQLVTTLEALRERQSLVGKTAAELHARGGWSWPKIAALLAVDQSTVYRWASPYMQRGTPSS